MTKAAKLQAVCAVCFNVHKLYANGNLVRHGFEIHGRRNGEFGLAWHTGPCNGISFPHFGISTEGTEWALEQARNALDYAEKQIAHLKTRPEFTWSAEPGTRLYKRGFTVEITVKPGDEGNRYAKVTDYMPAWEGNQHESFRLPSYDSMMETKLMYWKAKASACKSSIAFYEKAIATWEPRDATPVKPEVKLHKRSTWKRTNNTTPLCKQWQMREPHGSYDYAETDEAVNCKSCLRSMAAAKKEAEKRAKRVEKALTTKKGIGRTLLAQMVETGREPENYDYNAMDRLQSAGLVKRAGGHSDSGWTKPYYVPTDAGRAVLQQEVK